MGAEQPKPSTDSVEELVGQDQLHVHHQQPVLRRTRIILSVFQLLLELIWHKSHGKPSLDDGFKV